MFLRDTTEAIWAFTGTVLGLIVCVGFASIWRQIRHNSEGSSQADKWENATDAVMGFIDGDETRMARFSKLLKAEETRPIVIEALSNVSRTSANCSVRLRDRDADVAILRQWVSDSLEDKDAGRRAHACEVVGTLRLRACRGMVLAATGDEDVNVKVSATRAMAVIDPESAVGVLLGLIEEEGTWAADLLADLLQRIPASATEAVVLRAREWGATPALVKLLASSSSAVANDVLLGALETDDPELRARTAEAIHASSPDAIAALCALLTDPHEGTRLSAVRSLSRASNPEALLTLSSALSDSSRLVRFAAASGIAGTPGGGEVLQRVVTGSDRNASEAAELALWRLNTGAADVVPTEEQLIERNPTATSATTSTFTAASVSSVDVEPVSVQSAQVLPVVPAIVDSRTNDSEIVEPVSTYPADPFLANAESVTVNSASSASTGVALLATEPVRPVTPVRPVRPIVPVKSVRPIGPVRSVTSTVSPPKPSLEKKPGNKPTAPAKGSKLADAGRLQTKPSDVGTLGKVVEHSKRAQEARAATVAPTSSAGGPKSTPRRSAEVLAWLEEFLLAHDGVASAPVVKAAAAREGIAERTLERVRPTVATSMSAK